MFVGFWFGEMKWSVFVPFIVSFLIPSDRRSNVLNAPSLHNLASGDFNSWHSCNSYPVVGSITALIFIISDINWSSGADSRMIAFALWETIGLERLWIRVDRRIVGCGEGVAAGGCTLGTLVVSSEWSCTIGTIVGSFDWNITLGPSVGIWGLVGGSRRSRFLEISLRSSRVFLDVVPSGRRILFFTDYWSVVCRSSMELQEVHPWMVLVSWVYHEGTI